MKKVIKHYASSSAAPDYLALNLEILSASLAAVTYFRVEAGKPFLPNNIVGYAVGLVVPQLHKVASRRGISLVPLQGVNGYSYSGLLVSNQL